MDSKKCAALLRAVELGSLTAAAAELGYTQAGLTNMMNALETELGVSLLLRGRGGVRLSAAGRRLLPQLQAFVRAAEELGQSAEALRAAGAASLRVGAYSSVARHWLPSILADFRRECPEIEVSIVMGGNRDLHQLVRGGELDCAFASFHPSLEHGLDWLPLRKDPLLAVLPPDDEQPGEAFPVSAFAGGEFLMPSLSFDLDILPVFGENAAAAGPRLRYTNLDDAAIVSMVEHGLGLTILSELVMRSMNADVRVLPLDPPAWREIGILTARSRQGSRPLGRFLRCAEHTLHTMYDDPGR